MTIQFIVGERPLTAATAAPSVAPGIDRNVDSNVDKSIDCEAVFGNPFGCS
jgi:hypothetical protein